MRGLKILSFRTGLERESRPTRIIPCEKNHTPEINLPRVRGLRSIQPEARVKELLSRGGLSELSGRRDMRRGRRPTAPGFSIYADFTVRLQPI